MSKRHIDDFSDKELYQLLQECKQYQIKRYGQDWLDEMAMYIENNVCPRCGEKFIRAIVGVDKTGYCKYGEVVQECERCNNKWYLILIYPDHKEYYMYTNYISFPFNMLYVKDRVTY